MNISLAQNLVPNSSFENYYSCPTTFGQVYLCQNWSILNNDFYRPSYFNSCCSDTNTVSIPHNAFGYQYSASGNAYCGFVNESGGIAAVRQYLINQLSSPLNVGLKYFVSLKVSLSDYDFICASNKIGVLFSTVFHDSSYIPPQNNLAHIYTDFVIGDTMVWYQIKGSFIADSNYNYIMIGNFFSPGNVSVGPCSAAQNWASFYYIDDVCVSSDSITCFIIDVVKERNIQENIVVFPNPSSGEFRISFNNSNFQKKIYVFDILSNLILKVSTEESHFTINLSGHPKGTYFVKIEEDDHIKVIKLISM